jgi:hypothetical protein
VEKLAIPGVKIAVARFVGAASGQNPPSGQRDAKTPPDGGV